ncbi:MAG TPA: DUF3570 domain-containing protein [Arcobacter sp.]|nr:DUF3570 domain-containing protein [Arcobacter sp.]
MQLNQKQFKLSFVTASILLASSVYAQDYVRVNYMQYDENDNRVSVKAPSIEVNKDFGVDYTLNVSLVTDAVSGATPIYVDSISGASAFNSRGDNKTPIKKNVEFTEQRTSASFSLVSRLDSRDEITVAFSKSYESDYDANTLSIDYLHWANKSKNRSYNIGASYALNNILIKDCSYNAQCGAPDSVSGASKKEISNILSTEVGVTQLIDKTSLVKASIFYSTEDGYLSNPYYNVVRYTNKIVAEVRPDKRVAYGFNLKYIKAFTSTISSKFKYKFYTDDWDITSHTIDINNYYELNSKVTLGFGIRYYTQSEAIFYSKDTNYFTDEVYASHDDRLSSFNSTTLKTSVDYKYSKSLSYNISLDKYDQSTDLSAMYTTVGFKYKF